MVYVKKNLKNVFLIQNKWLRCKESTCSAGYVGWIPESGKYGVGNGHSLQYSCLENSTD